MLQLLRMRMLPAPPDTGPSAQHIISDYEYEHTTVHRDADGNVKAVPTKERFQFKTEKRVPRTGLMLVGWGGNNGEPRC